MRLRSLHSEIATVDAAPTSKSCDDCDAVYGSQLELAFHVMKEHVKEQEGTNTKEEEGTISKEREGTHHRESPDGGAIAVLKSEVEDDEDCKADDVLKTENENTEATDIETTDMSAVYASVFGATHKKVIHAGPIKCPSCLFTAHRPRSLHAHYVQCHDPSAGRAPISPPKTSISTPKPPVKIPRTLDAANYSKRAHRCADCPRAYAHVNSLVHHRRQCHEQSEVKMDGGASKDYKCDRSFDQHGSLRTHGQAMHGADIGHFVERHMRDKHDASKSDGKRAAITATDLYTEEYYSNRRFKCDRCRRAYPNGKGLQNHMLTVHKIRRRPVAKPSTIATRPFKCDECTTSCVSHARLSQHRHVVHKRAHLGRRTPRFDPDYYAERPFRCSVCPSAFSKRWQLTGHGKSAHKVAPLDRQTLTFDEAYRYTSSLRKHRLTAHGTTTVRRPTPNADGAHRCKRCPSVFAVRTALRQHGIKAHGVDIGSKTVVVRYDKTPRSDDNFATRAHKCHICNKAYRLPCGLRRHKMRIHALREKHEIVFDAVYYAERPLRCDRCERAYKARWLLNHHRRRAHGQAPPAAVFDAVYYAERPLRCDRCERAYKARWQLNHHRRRAHGQAPPAAVFDAVYYAARRLRCDRCQMAFTALDKLNRHRRSVHDVKTAATRAPPSFDAPFYSKRAHRCDRCQWAFDNAHNMSRHRASVHKDERGFKCVDYYDGCAVETKTHDELLDHHLVIHADAFEYNAVYYAARTHRCEHCPMAFYNDALMVEHMFEVHNDDRRTTNGEGEKEEKENMGEKEEKEKMGEKEKSYPHGCDQCPANQRPFYRSRGALLGHMEKEHGKSAEMEEKSRQTNSRPVIGPSSTTTQITTERRDAAD